MRRISRKSSVFEKIFSKFSISIFLQFFPKFTSKKFSRTRVSAQPPICKISANSSGRRSLRTVMPIGAPICKNSPTSRAFFKLIIFSQNPILNAEIFSRTITCSAQAIASAKIDIFIYLVITPEEPPLRKILIYNRDSIFYLRFGDRSVKRCFFLLYHIFYKKSNKEFYTSTDRC